MSRTTCEALAATLLMVAVVPGGAESGPEDVAVIQPYESLAGAEGTVERASWVRPIDVAVPIVVDNPFGDVHLRSSGPGGVLDVSAVLQQLGPEGARVDLEVDETPERLRLTVVRTVKPGVEKNADDRSRADLAVLVPEDATLTVTTVGGSVESRGVKATLTVRTASGDVTIRQKTGPLTVRSDSGRILAFLEPGATTGAESFESVTGGITVWLRDAADASVALATSGSLTTDFTLAVEHHDHDEPDKRALATVGTGGRIVTLTSRRGDLALRRLLPTPSD